MNLNHCSKLLFILPIIATLSTVIEAKTACEGCKDLVDGILKGLDRSKNKNFEGGDVAWEEKKNLKFKTSETRLVEILENVCPKDNFQCNKVLEENDEVIETWYKKMQDDKPLHDYLCIEKASVCCADDSFGEDCAECPKGESNEICFGHGTCEGAGDKAGSGKCICDAGYSGDLCNECANRYFKAYSNDTYTLCTLCHDTCETCTGANETECTACKTGYREEHGEEDKPMTCVDINECVQQRDLCPVGQYCANTEGSYQCEDIDECASGAICLGMYEVCVNTPGHYRCECARFFRRDAVSGQCQPDPAIYSRYLPHRAKKDEPKVELPAVEEKKEGGEYCENSETCRENNIIVNDDLSDLEDDSLSNDDIMRLVVAVVICLIGTAASKGSLVWGLLFFFSLFLTALWWASDKTEQIAHSFMRSYATGKGRSEF